MKLSIIRDDWYCYGVFWTGEHTEELYPSRDVSYEDFITAYIYDNLMLEANTYLGSIYERNREDSGNP